MDQEEQPVRDVDTTKGKRRPKYEPLHPPSDDASPIIEPSNEIIHGLQTCPIGDGKQYENLVLSASLNIFGNLVDASLVRQQVPIGGGFADIELPLCVELLAENKYRCWESWQRDYQIKSMLVEVKNIHKMATREDTVQLKGYVDGHSRGRFAFLVSRTGFKMSALVTICAYRRDGYLLMPLDNEDLLELITLSSADPIKVMRYLRRKETILHRIA
jgi:hypothetical protein